MLRQRTALLANWTTQAECETKIFYRCKHTLSNTKRCSWTFQLFWMLISLDWLSNNIQLLCSIMLMNAWLMATQPNAQFTAHNCTRARAPIERCTLQSSDAELAKWSYWNRMRHCSRNRFIIKMYTVHRNVPFWPLLLWQRFMRMDKFLARKKRQLMQSRWIRTCNENDDSAPAWLHLFLCAQNSPFSPMAACPLVLSPILPIWLTPCTAEQPRFIHSSEFSAWKFAFG